MTARFQYQVKAEPLGELAPPVVVPDLSWLSVYPLQLLRAPNNSLLQLPSSFDPLPIPGGTPIDVYDGPLIITLIVAEGAVGTIWGMFTDGDGRPLPLTALTSLSLTLYTITSSGGVAIVNGRNHQDVLNLNGVTVYDPAEYLPDGRLFNLKWIFEPGDTTPVEERPFSSHRARFEWTWPTGRKKAEALLIVQHLWEVP